MIRSPFLKTIKKHRNNNISNIRITWDHHELSPFLLPCPVELPKLPESIKTVPKSSPICPQALQMVGKLSRKHPPRPLPDVHKRFRRAPSRSRTIRKVCTFPPPPTHLHPKTMASSPRSKVPGQKSRVRGKVGGPPKGL